MTIRTTLCLLFVCACSSAPSNNPDSGAPNDAGADSPQASGPWTLVTPMDGSNSSATTVSGFYFQSPTNGFVSFSEGLVEHFSGPTTIDKISFDGSGKLGGGDDQFFGFIANTSVGLIVQNLAASKLLVSTDQGKTFAYTNSFKTISGAPQGISQNFPPLYVGVDKSNVWHMAISAGGGDVYSSPTPPGPNATLTLTWHPTGTVTVPATIPAGDCTDYVVDASQATQAFAGSTDGSSFVYASSDAICHSSDGGKTFVDVSANITPSSFTSHNPPLGFMFTSPTIGIGYYGSELDNPGSAYVLATTDGGASWTVATLPAAAQKGISLRHAFASPSGTMYLVGGGDTLVLWQSSDGGTTWTDFSAKLNLWAPNQPTAPVRLLAGYALDDDTIWIGGDDGFVAYTASGGK